MSAGNRVVDNQHMRDVAASIDVETGVVITDCVNKDGKTYEECPATGIMIKGFKILNYKQVIKVCKEISGKIKSADDLYSRRSIFDGIYNCSIFIIWSK